MTLFQWLTTFFCKISSIVVSLVILIHNCYISPFALCRSEFFCVTCKSIKNFNPTISAVCAAGSQK